MTSPAELPTPALLVDLDRLDANLHAMAERCRRLGVALRPHVKTHKCVEIGERQLALGPHPGEGAGITVSTLEEARAFAGAGFRDLTWAFPAVPGRLGEAVEIARRSTLRLLVDTPEGMAAVGEAARAAADAGGGPLHVWLEVDSGDGRSGVDPSADRALELARALAESPHVTFDGLLTHGGHAYAARSVEQAARAAEDERAAVVGLAERLRRQGTPVPGVSVGSTPGMTAVERAGGTLEGVTEARPGNYAYFDLTQVAIGSCTVDDCALTVLATVVSQQPGKPHSVVDAGALALSKDPGPAGDGEPVSYGRLLDRPEARLTSLSQEHGVVGVALPVGSKVRILPNHSCLAAACFDRVHAVSGDEVVAAWTVHRGR